ncbi:MAG TPA: hypothetical protein VD994_17075 [Prosthecobacter sp.]|nr:hypothetical protein [Prosthecobacter sp.]
MTQNTVTLKVNGQNRRFAVVARDDFSGKPLAKADNRARGIAAHLILKGARGSLKLAYETFDGRVIL